MQTASMLEVSTPTQSVEEPPLQESLDAKASDFIEDFFLDEDYLPEKHANFFIEQAILMELDQSLEKESIKEEFDLPIVRNKHVERYLKFFQHKGRKPFTLWLERSTAYLPDIKKALQEGNMPQDLAYLAMIESGFNVRAYSRRHASGMWQFIRSTGRRYGLRIDWWVDERRDIEKSTQAAIRYLKELYEEFGSWYLAAAAYNAGEGRIRKAIRRNGSNEFWEINKRKHLKWETINYVPKLIAATIIASNPEEYGFTSLKYRKPVEYDTVTVSDAIDLTIIAKCCGTNLKEIKNLNPALKRGCTPPLYSDYQLHIPKGSKEMFVKNLAEIPPAKRVTFRRHFIKDGETISEIAQKYRTPQRAILSFNRIRNPHRIRAGKNILIPIPANTSYAVKAKAQKTKMVSRLPAETGIVEIVYRVTYGDTLWDIARAYNLNIAEIKRWNNLKSNLIYPGKKLKLCIKEDEMS
jgi:membrane-bound lytic murein transglycosylase D